MSYDITRGEFFGILGDYFMLCTGISAIANSPIEPSTLDALRPMTFPGEAFPPVDKEAIYSTFPINDIMSINNPNFTNYHHFKHLKTMSSLRNFS